MSDVQRWVVAEIRMTKEEDGPPVAANERIVILADDHARIVAEMEQAHAAALAEQWERAYERGYEYARTGPWAAAPRTLTADDARAAVVRLTGWSAYKHDQGFERAVDEAVIAIDSLIHDGEATPEVKPCSTCGEPVAYLTARPGWAGGWLHHPARPLDGHPAAIDEEATP